MKRALTLLTLAAAALPAASASAATPTIWAHRGGSYVNGKATYPENTLPAFTNAARYGFTLELDVHLTKDGKLVVIHDEDLTRTTPCTDQIADITYADLISRCKSDILGSPGGPLGSKAKKMKPTTPLPLLSDVLKMAATYGAPVAPELKAYDPSGASARALAAVVKKAKFPLSKLTIQSFFPPNLAAIKPLLPGVKTSQLTLTAGNADGITGAQNARNTFVSPQFPVDATYVSSAHGAGLKIAAYTLDTPAEVKAAAALGIDTIITDDPFMAAKTLGIKLKPRP